MRSAALNKKNVTCDKATPERIVRGNGSAEVEPDGNVRLRKSRARPDLRPERRNTAMRSRRERVLCHAH